MSHTSPSRPPFSPKSLKILSKCHSFASILSNPTSAKKPTNSTSHQPNTSIFGSLSLFSPLNYANAALSKEESTNSTSDTRRDSIEAPTGDFYEIVWEHEDETDAVPSLEFRPKDAKALNKYMALRHECQPWEGIDEVLGLDGGEESDNDEWASSSGDMFQMREFASQLTNVPKIFFSDTFDLHHDATFSQLIAKYRISTLVQQEKLEYWMMVVESCLALELSMRSNDIFEILSEFDDLETLLKVCWEGSHELNETVLSLQRIMVEQPKQILRVQEESENESAQLILLNKMHHVLECVAMLDTLQESHQYYELITLVRELESLLETDLSEIVALGEVRTQLRARMSSLNKELQESTLHMIIFDPTRNTALNYQDLRPNFCGLVELRLLRSVLEAHKDQIKTRIFTTVLSDCLHQVMPELRSTENAHQFESKQLSNILRALDKNQFLRCVDLLFTSYLDIILHERRLSDAFLEFAEEAHSKLQFINHDTQQKIIHDAHTNLESMAQLCHSRSALVFSIQSGNMERLSRAELIQLMTKINRFITKTNTLVQLPNLQNGSDPQKPSLFSALRATIFAHGRVYVDKFHDTKVTALQSAIYSDTWDWNENNQEVQLVLNTQFSLQPPQPHDGKYLWLNDQPFCVASSTLILLSLLSKYFEMFDAKYSTFFQPLDICDRVVKLLTEYNREVRLQILGAKALERNLKTIKVGHLMLVSEVMCFLKRYVPHVRALSSKQLPEKRQFFLTNFDNLMTDFEEHHKAVHMKVRDILRFMMKEPLRVWGTLKWQASDLVVPAKPLRQMSLFLKRVYTKLKQYLLERNKEEFVQLFTDICDYYLQSIEREMDSIVAQAAVDSGLGHVVLRNLRTDIDDFASALARFRLLIADFDDATRGAQHRLQRHWSKLKESVPVVEEVSNSAQENVESQEHLVNVNAQQAKDDSDSTSTQQAIDEPNSEQDNSTTQ